MAPSRDAPLVTTPADAPIAGKRSPDIDDEVQFDRRTFRAEHRLGVFNRFAGFMDLCMATNLDQFGPALKLPWTYLPAPELTESLIDRVVEGTADQQGERSIAELERYRDDCLLAVLGAIKSTKARHGFAFAD